MKVFVVLSAFLAVATANPADIVPSISPLGLRYIAAPHAINYHSQDLLGQYAYGYENGLSAKQEVRSLDGVTRGSYRYVDAEGIVQTVHYVADDVNGFRVAGTNLPRSLPAANIVLPQPVVDTPEVAAARAAHLAVIDNVQARNVQPSTNVPVVDVELPKQVENTPEVAAARQAHLRALNEIGSQVNVVENVQTRNVQPSTDVPVADVELPKQVEDTPEVAAARQAHLRALSEAQARNLIAPIPIVRAAPIVDSPLVPRVVLPGFRFFQGTHGIRAPLAYSPILF